MNEPKPIDGMPGYQCDSLGSVYSLKTGSIKLMRQRTSSRGYRIVCLSVAGKQVHCLVHRLILQTFSGQVGAGLEVNHKNGVKTDNRLENLEWTTRTENERHARTTLGKNCRGERHKCAKLTTERVLELRNLRAAGWKYAELSKRFSISMTQACRIVKGEKWKHV